MAQNIENIELEPLKPHVLKNQIDYVSQTIVTRYILKKTTGHVSLYALDKDETLIAREVAHDHLIQILEGCAEVMINGQVRKLQVGQIVVIPAHAPNTIRAVDRLKMIVTLIPSGYEEFHVENPSSS
ncbi:MAG: hypothetical protein R8G66_25770 [Cytophagales bacterium]|nr:hypothetical protein [Cytophagales bacterium]